MPNPMKTLLPLAAGLVLGTWFAKRPVPPQARTLCPPAGQAGIRRQMEQLKRSMRSRIGCAGTLPPTSPMSSRPP